MSKSQRINILKAAQRLASENTDEQLKESRLMARPAQPPVNLKRNYRLALSLANQNLVAEASD